MPRIFRDSALIVSGLKKIPLSALAPRNGASADDRASLEIGAHHERRH